jgi:hypothetical protein
MKLKSLLFGSAAVLAAGTGALAADLPTVEPVEYVRICDAFGARFYYIPGTDTCLRVGGYVRVQSGSVWGDPADLIARYNPGGAGAAEINNWATQARGHILLDARTQTDFGLVRAYVAMEMTVGAANFTTSTAPNYSSTAPNLAAAFIQISNDWGTYTAGHTGSFFDFYGGVGWGFRLGEEAGTGEATLFAWTFAGGNGFSFTLSAEDPASIGRRRNGDDDYEGQEFPDGVANIRIDQGWGSAQIMGVVGQIHDVNGDGLGWAAGAGLSFNLPGGWSFSSQGGYSEGRLSYISSDIGNMGDFDGPTGQQTNTSWSARAGITGPLFAPNLTGWLGGSYIHAEENGNNDNYDFWAVLAGAKYEPVPGLYFGPEVAYNSYDFTNVNGNGANPNDLRADFDLWSVMWRVQRDF